MVPHRSSPDRLRTGRCWCEQPVGHVLIWLCLSNARRANVEPEFIALNGGEVLNQHGVGMTRALAGHLTGASGREMVFGLYLNDVMAPDVLNDSLTIIADHGAIVEEIYART